jgi:DNA invertase Pin-like site-specific DNA recombinase
MRRLLLERHHPHALNSALPSPPDPIPRRHPGHVQSLAYLVRIDKFSLVCIIGLAVRDERTMMAMRVGIYARVSTTDKEQDPTTQLLPLREFAQAQGWDVQGEYVDYASATDLRGRREWRRLLDLAAKRRVDVVLCWKLDRCFRSVKDAADTLAQLRAWKVGLRSYTESMIDTSSTSPWGELLFNLLAAFSQFERSLIAERVRAGMARAKKQGKALGRPRILNGEWETIAPQIASGQISQRDAAKQLGVGRGTIQRRLREEPPA